MTQALVQFGNFLVCLAVVFLPALAVGVTAALVIRRLLKP